MLVSRESGESPREALAEYCSLSAVALLIGLVSILLLTAVLYFLGKPISSLNLWLPLVGTVIFLAVVAKSLPRFVALLIGQAVILIPCLLIGGIAFDLSYDGQTYHQEAIILLGQGWNPFFGIPVQGINQLWINHYAKASEIFAAVLFHSSGNVEIGKSFNLILMGASFLLMFSAIARLGGGLGLAGIFAFLLAFNPVSLYQSLTYYVDGPLASLMVIYLAIACLLWNRSRPVYFLGLAACLILLCNLKFTGLAYAGLLTLGTIGVFFFLGDKPRLKPFVAVSAASGLLAVSLVGFNPYITNMLHAGHPFHPLSGPDAVDIMTPNMPADFQEKGRVEKMAISLFSRSDNPKPPAESQLKWPFFMTEWEVKTFTSPDARTGGFGPLFSGALLLSGVVFLWAFLASPRRMVMPMAVLLVIWGTALANPEGWWARYAPQIWVAALLPCFVVLRTKSAPVLQGVSVLTILALVINLSIVAFTYFGGQVEANLELRRQLARLREQPETLQVYFYDFQSNRHRLQQAGVKFQEAPAPTFTTTEKLVASRTELGVFEEKAREP